MLNNFNHLYFCFVYIYNFKTICNSFSSCYSIPFHYMLIIAYLVYYNTIYLPSQHVGHLYKVIHLLAFFHKRNTFSYDILDGAADQQTYLSAMKFHYKLSLTGGLILFFGLVCLLLICFRLDFNVHASQLFILSLLSCGWYGFRWFCIFL